MIANESDARAFCAQRCDPLAMERLDWFAAALADENSRQNLVSVSSLAAIWQRHFADSIQLQDHVPRGTDIWLDLGTGAGFPGLVLAAANPSACFTLVESRKRRVDWLKRCIAHLELDRCQVLGERLETVASFPATAITARAFAPLDRLLQLSARFSTPATVWLLPKGRSAEQELASQARPVREMFHVEQSATDPDGGILVGRGIAP